MSLFLTRFWVFYWWTRFSAFPWWTRFSAFPYWTRPWAIYCWTRFSAFLVLVLLSVPGENAYHCSCWTRFLVSVVENVVTCRPYILPQCFAKIVGVSQRPFSAAHKSNVHLKHDLCKVWVINLYAFTPKCLNWCESGLWTDGKGNYLSHASRHILPLGSLLWCVAQAMSLWSMSKWLHAWRIESITASSNVCFCLPQNTPLSGSNLQLMTIKRLWIFISRNHFRFSRKQISVYWSR